MRAVSLGSLELTVLLSVLRLGEEAYGLAIRHEVSDRARHDYSVGAIYTTLQRLEDKGLVSWRVADPLPIRGGRARRLFRLSAAGRRAISDAARTATATWAGTTHIPGMEPA